MANSPYLTSILPIIARLDGHVPFATKEQLALCALALPRGVVDIREFNGKDLTKANEIAARKIVPDTGKEESKTAWHQIPFPYPREPLQTTPLLTYRVGVDSPTDLERDGQYEKVSEALLARWWTGRTIPDRAGNRWQASQWVSSFGADDARSAFLSPHAHLMAVDQFFFHAAPQFRFAFYQAWNYSDEEVDEDTRHLAASAAREDAHLASLQGKECLDDDTTWCSSRTPHFVANPNQDGTPFLVFLEKCQFPVSGGRLPNPNFKPPAVDEIRIVGNFKHPVIFHSTTNMQDMYNLVNDAYLRFLLNIEITNWWLGYYLSAQAAAANGDDAGHRSNMAKWLNFRWVPVLPAMAQGRPQSNFIVQDDDGRDWFYSLGPRTPECLDYLVQFVATGAAGLVCI